MSLFEKQGSQAKQEESFDNLTLPQTQNRASVKQTVESAGTQYIKNSFGKITAYLVQALSNTPPSDSLENSSFSPRSKE
jgi:hypothetical protein